MNSRFYYKDIKNTVLFGGIDYMVDTTTWKNVASSYHTTSETATSRGYGKNLNDFNYEKRGGYEIWEYLEGTAKEAEIINKLMLKNNISTKYYTKIEATEEVFKSLSNNTPTVLHIATHGFYFPADKRPYKVSKNLTRSKNTHSNNPLIRSGLIFAGANHTWNNEDVQGIEDGTLSAYEVSHLNLFDCKLVVLSACQTGLGDVGGSEGIYGLQRGFKMASVDFMIYTLWSVDDHATQLFMTTFFA